MLSNRLVELKRQARRTGRALEHSRTHAGIFRSRAAAVGRATATVVGQNRARAWTPTPLPRRPTSKDAALESSASHEPEPRPPSQQPAALQTRTLLASRKQRLLNGRRSIHPSEPDGAPDHEPVFTASLLASGFRPCDSHAISTCPSPPTADAETSWAFSSPIWCVSTARRGRAAGRPVGPAAGGR